MALGRRRGEAGAGMLKSENESPSPALAPLPPRLPPAPLRSGGSARSGARGSSRTAATLGGCGEGGPARGAESQQGLWRSCVAEFGIEGRCPCYSLTPPFIDGGAVLRPAAELAAPAGSGKEEKPAKGGRGRAGGGGRGGGGGEGGWEGPRRQPGKERRESASGQGRGAEGRPGAGGGGAQPREPQRLSPSPSGGAKLRF